jgi:hypothetical protein
MRAPAIRVNARMLRPAFAKLGYGVSLQVRMPPSGPWSGNGGTIVFLHPIALRYKQNCGLYALIQAKEFAGSSALSGPDLISVTLKNSYPDGLHVGVVQALESDNVKDKATAEESEVVASSPREFAVFFHQEAVKYRDVARRAGIKDIE